MWKVFAFLVTAALARNFVPSDDPNINAFYRNAMQPDTRVSCCGEADAYWADSFEIDKDGEYVAIITDDRVIPQRPSIPVGTRVIIPNEKLANVASQSNPTGHGIVFVNVNLHVFCYFSPGLG